MAEASRIAKNAIGRGYNQLTGEVKTTALTWKLEEDPADKITAFKGHIELLENQDRVFTEFRIDARAKLSAFGVGASASFSFASTASLEKNSVSLVGLIWIPKWEYEIDKPAMTEEAFRLVEAEEYGAFIARYGDKYVRGVTAGGLISVVVKFRMSSYYEAINCLAAAQTKFGGFTTAVSFSKKLERHGYFRKCIIDLSVLDGTVQQLNLSEFDDPLKEVTNLLNKAIKSVQESTTEPYVLWSDIRSYSEVINYIVPELPTSEYANALDSAGAVIMRLESLRGKHQLVVDFEDDLPKVEVDKSRLRVIEINDHIEALDAAAKTIMEVMSAANLESAHEVIGKAKEYLVKYDNIEPLIKEMPISYTCTSRDHKWKKWEKQGGWMSREHGKEMTGIRVDTHNSKLHVALDVYMFQGHVGFGSLSGVSIIKVPNCSADDGWEAHPSRVAVGLRFRLAGAAAGQYILRWQFNDNESKWYRHNEWAMTGPYHSSGKGEQVTTFRIELYLKMYGETEA